MDKCPNYQNNGYLDAHLKKGKKRDSPCCPAKLFPSSKKERYVYKEQSRIRLATKYSTHMHILI
jgi:hypothetical protein